VERKDTLKDSWASLGIAFNGAGVECADPESAIVALVSSGEFPRDKKMMGLALLWLNHFSKLVHVERLSGMAKKLKPFELALLGGIAKKCVSLGDFRWRLIESLCAEGARAGSGFPGDNELFIEMRGLDADFASFGVRVAPILPDHEKKLLARATTIKGNAWLKNRLLFGSNSRADVATLKELKLAKTAYAAAKILGCSANTAYRNWNDLEEAGWAL
jgi:hypothetical protein